MGYENINHTVQFGTKEGKPVAMVELASIFGTSSKTIKTWVDKGMPFEGGSGKAYRFDSAKCLRWRVQYEADVIRELLNVQNEPEKMLLNEAKRRQSVAQALQAELNLEKEREAVANIDDLMENFMSALTNVRAKLISMPARLSGMLSHQDDETVAKLLDSEIVDMLEELNNYSHEYVESEVE